jgi:hypothetical protein
MKAAFLVLILLIVARTTSSQIPHSVPAGTNDSPMFHSGNDLLRKCQGTEYEKNKKNYCLAYIITEAPLLGSPCCTAVVAHSGKPGGVANLLVAIVTMEGLS